MILFSPGPANITNRVRQALLLPDISHRGPEFTDLLQDIRARILDVCGVSRGYRSVVYTGSGSLAIESVASAMRGLGEMLVISNGVYGPRAASMARYHGVEVEEWELPWGELPDPEDLYARLDRGGFRSVWVVHHETTTGGLNPLPDLSKVTKPKDVFLLVDAISSVAGEHIDIEGWGVDGFLGTANKCIRGVAGASFAVVSDRLVQSLPKEEESHYSSLQAHIANAERGETPFTPAVQTCYAFREALHEVLEEGVDKRIGHYEKLSSSLRNGLRGLGLQLLLPEERYSNTMLSYHLPKGFTYASLNEATRARGFNLYEGQGHLRPDIFRLGLVGDIKLHDADRFISELGDILKTQP